MLSTDLGKYDSYDWHELCIEYGSRDLGTLAVIFWLRFRVSKMYDYCNNGHKHNLSSLNFCGMQFGSKKRGHEYLA